MFFYKSFFLNYNFNSLSSKFEDILKLNFFLINLCVIILILMIIMNFIFLNNKDKNWLYFLNISSLIVLLNITIFRFYQSLVFDRGVGIFMEEIKFKFFSINNLNIYEINFFFCSSFSDSILILGVITSIICLDMLGSKNLIKSLSNYSIFFIFLLSIIILVYTKNLLIMFLSFEALFIPTVWIAYKSAYNVEANYSIKILVFWTLSGAFLILCTLFYIYSRTYTLNYVELRGKNFSNLEVNVITVLIFLGFGVKIPVAPFHIWLLEIHVKSPAGFSIFLSGFLVKAGFFCLVNFTYIFQAKEYIYILLFWTVISVWVSSIEMLRVIDLKKLIALATVQEMSFMLIFVMTKQLFESNIFILFTLMHGLLSSIMFYIVDIIEKRLATRNLYLLRGLQSNMPKIVKYLWLTLIFFVGFPGTIKFLLEWQLILSIKDFGLPKFTLVAYVGNFIGNIFFSKAIFSILYSKQISKKKNMYIETQNNEFFTLNFLLILFILLNILFFVA